MTVNLGVAIRMTEDVGYDPPQGSVLIVSDSGIFQVSRGLPHTCTRCVRVCMQVMMVCGSCAAGGGVLECRGGHRDRRADRDPSQSQVP